VSGKLSARPTEVLVNLDRPRCYQLPFPWYVRLMKNWFTGFPARKPIRLQLWLLENFTIL
jgi:hypothetical protein